MIPLSVLTGLVQGIVGVYWIMTAGSLIYREYYSVNLWVVAACCVFFAACPLPNICMFRTNGPAIFSALLFPFGLLIESMDPVEILTVLGIVLIFGLQVRGQNGAKFQQFSNMNCPYASKWYQRVSMNILWVFIPVMFIGQYCCHAIYGGLNLLGVSVLEYFLFQGTFLVFTVTQVNSMLKMGNANVQVAGLKQNVHTNSNQLLPTGSNTWQPAPRHFNMNQLDTVPQLRLNGIPEDVGLIPQNADVPMHNFFVKKQYVLKQVGVWWAYWPLFAGIYLLVILGVYQHGGLFGLFDKFSCQLMLSGLLLAAFWLQQNHATNPLKWKLSNVKTTLLYMIIAMFIIMFGDIKVSGEIITMPELLVQYFCIVTGNFAPFCIWVIARLKALLDTTPPVQAIAAPTSAPTPLYTQVLRWIIKQIVFYVIDLVKDQVWLGTSNFLWSLVCKNLKHMVVCDARWFL